MGHWVPTQMHKTRNPSALAIQEACQIDQNVFVEANSVQVTIYGGHYQKRKAVKQQVEMICTTKR
jgi:hypothetical protein